MRDERNFFDKQALLKTYIRLLLTKINGQIVCKYKKLMYLCSRFRAYSANIINKLK